MIPKIIWQTYKDPFYQLPQYAKACAQTWKDLNPEYKYMYMDDEEARSFILHEFGEDWLEIFDSCPVGVMRGDIWRYLVIYTYGGVYADLDTICLKPISEWVDSKYSVVISEDDIKETYNQLTFASEPNNIIFKTVIDEIKNGFQNPNYNNKNFVDELTGVKVWTKAIKSINLDVLKNIYIYPENKNIYLQNSEALYFDQSVKHLTASANWKEDGYVQWQKEILKVLKYDS
jgi:mannosyltransferase OCH1-like enzyme